MITASLAAFIALAGQGQSPEGSSYTDSFLGLAFTIPKSWSVTKKTKDMTRYSIPVEGSAMPAELEIIRTPFHSSKEIWQTIQTRTNETLKRDIVRQWEQDVIEVPILFTQVNWNDKGVAKTTLSGLYYTRTPLKMLLRLTSAAGDFDKVRYEFQTALETLRTINGAAPQVDDEAVKFEPAKKPEPVPDRPKVIDGGPRAPGKSVKPPVTVPITVSTKPVVLRLPEGWTAGEVQEGKVTVRHAKLSAPVTLEVRSLLDSEKATSALMRQAGATLEQFEAGATRHDTEPKLNAAGCRVSTVWRLGKGKEGDLFTFDASGEQGDFYLLGAYRSKAKSALKGDQKLIRELFDQISLETPQP